MSGSGRLKVGIKGVDDDDDEYKKNSWSLSLIYDIKSTRFFVIGKLQSFQRFRLTYLNFKKDFNLQQWKQFRIARLKVKKGFNMKLMVLNYR